MVKEGRDGNMGIRKGHLVQRRIKQEKRRAERGEKIMITITFQNIRHMEVKEFGK